MDPQLSARGITQRFGDRVVLDAVDLDVPAGRVVGLLGPNGAGKTTLMRILFGVLAADAGTLTWRDGAVTADDRRGWGYMPQERGLYRDMRVLDLLVWIARLHGLERADGRRRARSALLEQLDLAERAPRQDLHAVGRHGATRATRGGDGARARSPGARRAVRRARPGRGPLPVRRDHRAHSRRWQPPLLEPPARPRRGPVRDDHAAAPRPGRVARRPPHAQGREPEPLAARRRRGRPVVDRPRRRRRSRRSTPAARGCDSPRTPIPAPCSTTSVVMPGSTTSGWKRRACPSCSSKRPARRPRDLAAGDAPRRRTGAAAKRSVASRCGSCSRSSSSARASP